MKKHFILTLLAAAIMACNQDPLAEYPAEIRNAKPEGKTEEDPTKYKRDGLIIETELDSYSVKEGSELKFPIRSRVLIPDTEVELFVKNIDEFPGATVDMSTGMFEWEVPGDLVKSDFYAVMPLHIVLVTTTTPIIMKEKTLNIMVVRDIVAPEIVSVTGLDDEIVEGRTHYFQVDVRSLEDNAPPTLAIILNKSGPANGSGYVSLRRETGNPIQDKNDPTLWKFDLQIDLQNVEITKSRRTIYFGIQAHSSLGRFSTVHNASVRVRTSFAEPKVSWLRDVEFIAEQKNVYTFTVYDPKEEGRIQAEFLNCADLSANCFCDTQTATAINCTIEWTPAAQQAGKTHNIRVMGHNHSTVVNDKTVTSKEFFGLRIKVHPKPEHPNPEGEKLW